MITRAMDDRIDSFTPEAMLDVRYIVLPDGRRLSYTEFGDPSGFPLIYCHGPGSTRLEATLFHREAKKARFRLISFDRPGLGYSDFRKGGGQAGFAQDLLHLANSLGCEKFGLLSSGGATSLALAASCWYSDRIALVLGLSFSPPQNNFLQATPVFVRKLALAALRVYAGFRQKRCARNPMRYLVRLRDTLCYADKRALEDPLVLEMLSKDVKESLRQGRRGFAHDISQSIEPWEFDPEKVHVPVHLWQGGADTLCPRHGVESVVRQLQNAVLHTVTSRGHFFYFRLIDEVFAVANKQLNREMRRYPVSHKRLPRKSFERENLTTTVALHIG
ncbi:MAG: alpha/beta hydrolase [Pseudomonadota bacterium]